MKKKPFLRLKSKKGVTESVLVLMIAAMIGLLVLLIVTGAFGKIFKSVLGKNECQMEFFISSITKSANQVGAQVAEPNCDPHLITITEKNLSDGREKAKKALKEYQSNYEKYKGITSAQNYFNYYKEGVTWTSKDPANSKATLLVNEWAMNKIVADEMKYCWDITGRGKFDLFNDWWMLIDCVNENDKTKYHPCTKDEVYSMYSFLGVTDDKSALIAITASTFLAKVSPFKGGLAVLTIAGAPLLYKSISGDIQAAKPPTFCVLCARIKFSEDAKNAVNGQEITSLSDWMANNPVTNMGETYSKVPYALYIQNDDYKGIWASKDSYSYRTDQAYAVLYARINVFKAESILKSVGEMIGTVDKKELPEAIQMIKLVQYSTIKEQCDYLVG